MIRWSMRRWKKRNSSFAELIRENLPARNLIASDFTFVNERLAKHYGLPLAGGSEPAPRGTATAIACVAAC